MRSPSCPAARGCSRRTHPGYAGLYWGPVSSPGVAWLVESADAYLFAGALLSDYATTGFTRPDRPEEDDAGHARGDPSARRELHRRGPGRLPRRPGRQGASERTFRSSEFLAREARPPRRPSGRRREADDRGGRPPGPRCSGAETALLVETGDSWFNGLETRLPEGCRFEIQFQAGSIGWSVPATLGYELGFKEPRRVISMIGDGSFQFTAQEVSTMIRHGTRPIIILVNNHGYIDRGRDPRGAVQQDQELGLRRPHGRAYQRARGRASASAPRRPGELAAVLKTALGHGALA